MCEFDPTSWLGDFTVWETGEAELTSVRTVDDWMVNKHYEPASCGDLEVAMDELQDLPASSSAPPSAQTFRNVHPL